MFAPLYKMDFDYTTQTSTNTPYTQEEILKRAEYYQDMMPKIMDNFKQYDPDYMKRLRRKVQQIVLVDNEKGYTKDSTGVEYWAGVCCPQWNDKSFVQIAMDSSKDYIIGEVINHELGHSTDKAFNPDIMTSKIYKEIYKYCLTDPNARALMKDYAFSIDDGTEFISCFMAEYFGNGYYESNKASDLEAITFGEGGIAGFNNLYEFADFIATASDEEINERLFGK